MTRSRRGGPRTALPLPRWTIEQVRALGTVTTVEIAGEALRLRRDAAYRLARANRFPVPVVKLHERKWVVPTAALVRLLEGVEPNPTDSESGGPQTSALSYD